MAMALCGSCRPHHLYLRAPESRGQMVASVPHGWGGLCPGAQRRSKVESSLEEPGRKGHWEGREKKWVECVELPAQFQPQTPSVSYSLV